MKDSDIDNIMEILQRETTKFNIPMAESIAEESSKRKRPFRVLVSTMLSSRTKDTVTKTASEKLFELGESPEELIDLPLEIIEKAIYPVGFGPTKAKRLHSMCKMLIDEFKSEVPKSMEDLLKLPGIGRKTANLVLGIAFGIPAICVDTHVHRICNRLGYIKTKNPEETEKILRQKLPKKYWIEINSCLVKWGQNVCVTISPFCSSCPIKRYCDRTNVKKSR